MEKTMRFPLCMNFTIPRDADGGPGPGAAAAGPASNSATSNAAAAATGAAVGGVAGAIGGPACSAVGAIGGAAAGAMDGNTCSAIGAGVAAGVSCALGEAYGVDAVSSMSIGTALGAAVTGVCSQVSDPTNDAVGTHGYDGGFAGIGA